MLHDEKKITKIIEELTIFFFGIGGDDITSNIKKVGNEAIITFKSSYDKEFEYKINYMSNFLKNQRNEVIEDIYWELAGSGDPGETSQLLLIGMMLDEVSVVNEDGCVTIEMRKQMY